MSYADSQKNLKSVMCLENTLSNLADFQGVRVHRDLVEPLQTLYQKSTEAGFELAVASGFRSVERQCEIWNAKAQGIRPVLDDAGGPLDITTLDRDELMFAILRWSALPGASRHHWGTDIDVYDRAALPKGQSLQLTVAECQGPFAHFHQWLDLELADPDAQFFRPYVSPIGGVAPEPWHLSFAPKAAECQRELGKDQLLGLLIGMDILLKDEVIRHFDEIYERFVWVSPNLYPPNWAI